MMIPIAPFSGHWLHSLFYNICFGYITRFVVVQNDFIQSDLTFIGFC